MTIDYKNILKTTAKVSFYIISRALASGLTGLFINIVMLLVLIPEMGIILDKLGGIPAANAGGIGALIALFVIMILAWPITLMIIGFGVVFPITYFVFGKKHGINKAIHYVINNNKEFIMVYFFDKLKEYINSRTELKDTIDFISPKMKILQGLQAYLRKMDNMPPPIRIFFRFISSNVNFIDMTKTIIENSSDELNLETLTDIAISKTGDFINDKYFKPTLKWLWILLSINFLLFIILKVAI